MLGTQKERNQASFDRGARLVEMMDGGMTEGEIAAHEGEKVSTITMRIHRHRAKVAGEVVSVAGTIRKIELGNFNKMVARAKPLVNASKGDET